MNTAKRPTGPFQSASTVPPQEQDQNQILLLGVMLASLLGSDENSDEATPDAEGMDSGLAALFASLFAKPGTSGTANTPNPELQTTVADAARKYIPAATGTTVLDPALIAAMSKDSNIRHYAEYAIDQAQKHGLDGNLFANQLWQESKFRPQAKSEEGAKGIGQFIASTGATYGLHTDADFYNPLKSINAAASYMEKLTNKYHDQRLAMVDYNGGGGAIASVAKALGTNKGNVTINDFMNEMAERREHKGTHVKSAWHVETFNYVRTIDSNFWSTEKRDAAFEKMVTTGIGGPAMVADNRPQPAPAG